MNLMVSNDKICGKSAVDTESEDCPAKKFRSVYRSAEFSWKWSEQRVKQTHHCSQKQRVKNYI